MAARELGRLSLEDALSLCVLPAEQATARFERAARAQAHWCDDGQCAATAAVAEPPGVNAEALIKEARRCERRRRRGIALALVALLATAVAAPYGFEGGRSSRLGSGRATRGAPATRTLRLQLRGFGTPLPTTIDSGPCPQGRTVMPIYSDAGVRLGAARLCVLAISKLDLPHWGVRRIVQTVREVDALPGGTVVSRQRQTFLFARDQHHSRAIFRGQVVGGSGRYARLRGSVLGGGPGRDGRADWVVTLRLRR